MSSHSTLNSTPGDDSRPIPPNDAREIFGWTMYDWASSAFSTTVVSVFFGPFLTAITEAAADANGFIYILGIPIKDDSWFAYCVSISVGLQVLFLPILGAIADFSHLRKRMLIAFSTLGALLTILLYLITPGLHIIGGVLFILANLSFGAAVVFYNAYLPDIASRDRRDSVSSRGFALGYAGGGILLLLNLVFVLMAGRLGIGQGDAVRISLASAGVWWLLFSFITFRALRPRHAIRELPPGENFITIGFKQLANTIRQVGRFPETVRYLLAYLVYNDGIQTVIVVATLFGSQELGMPNDQLILVILVVQVVAFVGALLFNVIAANIGTKRAIVVSLVVWTAVVFYAYAILGNNRAPVTLPLFGSVPFSTVEFFLLAMVVGTVLGGSQALSRSLFSQMIPHGREAEFFSFYEVSDRFTSTLGPLVFGLANQLTGSLKIGVLSVAIFFFVGLVLLIFVNVPRAISEAETAHLAEATAAP
jgi:UMF1 family MFS transporter